MQTVTGTCKYPAGKVFTNAKGTPSINAVFTLQDGSECRVFGKPGDSDLEAITKGQTVELNFDGKWYNLSKGAKPAANSTPSPATATAQPRKSLLDDPEKLAATTAQLCDLYRNIYERLMKGDPNDPLDVLSLREEDLAAATATVFIQTCKMI